MESKIKQHDIGVFGCDYDCLRTSFSSMQCIQKQTSVCFFLCGLQLRHFHPFICCHLGTGFLAGHIQSLVLQHISVSQYCPLANHELYEARLVEGTAQECSALLYVVSSYQAFVLNGCSCTSVYSFRICDGRWWYTSKTASTNHSVHQHTVLWTRQTASCANVLLLPFILFYQTYPINDTG